MALRARVMLVIIGLTTTLASIEACVGDGVAPYSSPSERDATVEDSAPSKSDGESPMDSGVDSPSSDAQVDGSDAALDGPASDAAADGSDDGGPPDGGDGGPDSGASLDGGGPPVGSVAWYRADLGVESDGGAVTAWRDQSGNGHDLTVPSGHTRPAPMAAAINGRLAIRFNGVDDATGTVLQSAPFAVPLPQPTTIVLVAKAATNNGVSTLFDGLDIGKRQTIYSGTTMLRLYAGLGLDFPNVFVTTKPLLIVAKFNSGQGELRVNGFTTTGNVGPDPLSGVSVGGGFGTGWYTHDGDIGEVLVYGRALNAAETTIVETYLRNAWTLP